MTINELPEERLPRDSSLMGHQLRIVQLLDHEHGDFGGGIAITDGERTALYIRDRALTPAELLSDGRPNYSKDLPQIVPFYIEAGRFAEANCVAIFDGKETALYLPSRILMAEESGQRLQG